MVTSRLWAFVRASAELIVACAAFAGAGLSWSHARHTLGVAPVADGQPATTQMVFDPQLLLLTLLLATIAGVLAVLGAARLRRAASNASLPV